MDDESWEKNRQRIWDEYEERGGDNCLEAIQWTTKKLHELNDLDYIESKLIDGRRYIEITARTLMIMGVLVGTCLIWRSLEHV